MRRRSYQLQPIVLLHIWKGTASEHRGGDRDLLWCWYRECSDEQKSKIVNVWAVHKRRLPVILAVMAVLGGGQASL